MKQKPRWTLEMLTASLAVLCGLLVLVLLVQRPTAWPVLAALVVLWGICMVVFRYQLRRWTARWMSGTGFEKSKVQFSLEPLSQPAALLSGETVLWYNAQFRDRLLRGQDVLVSRVQKVLPGLDLQQCRTQEGQLLTLAEGMWSAHSSTVPGNAESMTLVVLNEETALRKIEAEYKASRPGYLVFLVDGYDDVFGDMLDSERARLLEGINRTLEDMIGRGSGFLRRVASGRYIAVVEERQMEQFAKRGYDVLDKIRALDPSVNLSLSIGIGRGAKTLREAQDMAVQALDMAQGRGGDQAAVRTKNGYDFYGGLSKGVEKRTKVKTRIVAQALSELIASSKNVILMGHRFADMDCFGAAVALHKAVTQMGKPAWIAIDPDRNMVDLLYRRVAENGYREYLKAPSELMDVVEEGTLLIVVDTHSKTIIESRELYEKCRSVAVIDHHRKLVEYIDNATIFYHEPYASSACEMVTELVQYLSGNIRLTRLEAEALLAGIMLDTKNFVSKAGVRTFEAAAYLRRLGAETSDVRKYFNTSLSDYQQRIKLMASAELYHGCAVASTNQMIEDINVVAAQAADELLNINGVAASFVMYETGRGVNFSARSMGEMNVQIIMESLGGGGHLTMAGAQLSDCTLESARQRLFEAIDDYLSKNPRPAK